MDFKGNMIINLYKPKCFTSNDVVQIIKKKYHFKKVGHAGTLDPNATGVMLLGTNDWTKKINELIEMDKTYVSIIKFGIKTDTGDITGKIVQEQDTKLSDDNIKMIEAFLSKLMYSDYFQVPHSFSAVKINGKKAYEYARACIDIKIEPRLVKLINFKIVCFDLDNNTITLSTDVSKGFYIRSLVKDISECIKIPATLLELERTRIGNYLLQDSLRLIKSDHKDRQ